MKQVRAGAGSAGCSPARLERALVETAGWHRATTTDGLAQAVCESLRRAIRCDAAGWNEIDLDGHVVRALLVPHVDFPAATLNRLIGTHPVLRHILATGDPSACTISDLLDVEAFHRSAIYREFYGPLGIEDQLVAMVEIDGLRAVGVAFNRSARTFTRGDRRLLDLLRPHVVAAYERVLRRTTVDERLFALESGLEQLGQTVVFTDGDGTLTDVPAAARELLRRWFDEVPPRVEPGTYEREDGTLLVRPVATARARLLLLDERRFALSAEAARARGLTPREREVVLLAGRGLTNREIGAELRISPRTVHKHLENVYEKLGVGSREAAVALLRDHEDPSPASAA